MNSSIPSPIFIVGMNGSGTTMVADCLNHHPLIYFHERESRIIPYYYKNSHKFGDLNSKGNFDRLIKEFSNNHAFRICNNNLPINIEYTFESLEGKTLSKVIDLTFSYFALKNNKRIWGDHSPRYALSIPILIDLFPQAKIIHIFRDVRDCAESFNRRFGQNIYRTVFLWKKLIMQAREDGFLAGKERYFEIRYEDLTEEPELNMKNICSFLHIPYNKVVLQSSMPMYGEKIPNLANLDENKIVRNTGKYHERLTRDQIARTESIAGTALHEFGYEVLFVKGNKEITNIKLAFWKLLDKINATIYFYNRYDKRPKDMIGIFIRRLKNAYRSW